MPLKKAFAAFASMKIGLILLGSISAAAAVGTLVPQGSPPRDATLAALDSALSLTDLYRSWWFISLLVALVANTGACAIRQASAAFRFRGSIPERVGKYARWLVHPAVALLAIGALIGAAGGTESFSWIAEGDTLRLPADASGGRAIDVRLDSARVERYADGSVSDWVSEVTILEDGKAVGSYPIRVNHPAAWRGIHLLQSSFAREFAVSFRDSGDGEWSDGFFVSGRAYPLSEDGSLAIAFSESPEGACLASIVRRGTPGEPRALERGRAVEIPEAGLELSLGGARTLSGLKLRTAPGIWLVWLALALLSASAVAAVLAPRPSRPEPIGETPQSDDPGGK
jgi:hypothetical protein